MTDIAILSNGLMEASGALRQAKRIVVMAHVNPDADAVGSLLGFTLGLRSLGKHVTPALSDPVPAYAQFLKGADEVVYAMPDGPIDVLLCGDAADIERIGTLYTDNRARFESTTVVNVDHHGTNPRYGNVNYVEADASSTSELVYRILTEMEATIDADTASALMFGLEGDTGSFQNGATTPSSLEVAADLVRRGADFQRIAFQLFERKRFVGARLWGRAISTTQLDVKRRIVTACITQSMLREEGAKIEETEGVAEFMRGIEEADMVVLLKETIDGEMRVSMRSRPQLDVAAIASALGGGGHRQAAGCTIAGPAEEAIATLFRTYDTLNPR